MSQAATCPLLGPSAAPSLSRHGSMTRPRVGAGECPWLDAGDEGQGHPLEEADDGMHKGWTEEPGCPGWSPSCEPSGLLLQLSSPVSSPVKRV